MLNNYFLKNYSDGQSSVKVEAGLAQTILEAKRQGNTFSIIYTHYFRTSNKFTVPCSKR